MASVKIRELTLKDFSQYGSFANMINPKATKIGDAPVEFFRDMVQLDLGGKSIASFSICRVLKRPAVIDVTEYHSSCGEGILPLDGDILVHVGPATPADEVPLDKIEVFRVPKGTFLSLRPGVWHHAPFADGCDCVNTVIVLPERTYANDCIVYELETSEQIAVKGA